jgi:SAM-dependent methyltransferase
MENAPNFEFDALKDARRYRAALFQEFGAHLRGEVLEVGAGIGQMTRHLLALPAVRRTTAVEPDPALCAVHRVEFPKHELVQGTAADLPPGSAWDAIFSVNVLEHIEDDEGELRRYAGLLGPRSGCICLFVPARPELYAPIDKDFGHFRRYTKPELRRKLSAAGFEILRLDYFNWVGYFAWWANFCLLKKRCFEPAKLRFYDRVIFPVVHGMESRILRPPFGQSLITVARSRAGKPVI